MYYTFPEANANTIRALACTHIDGDEINPSNCREMVEMLLHWGYHDINVTVMNEFALEKKLTHDEFVNRCISSGEGNRLLSCIGYTDSGSITGAMCRCFYCSDEKDVITTGSIKDFDFEHSIEFNDADNKWYMNIDDDVLLEVRWGDFISSIPTITVIPPPPAPTKPPSPIDRWIDDINEATRPQRHRTRKVKTPPPTSLPSLPSLPTTVGGLRKLAQTFKIKRYSVMTKDELISKLREVVA
jgi:hypothetical protein